MKFKSIITAVLLMFVAASVVYLVVKETGGKAAQNPAPSGTILSVSGEHPRGATLPPDKAEASKVVAYYFHGNARCTTCRTIESYAKEAIETKLADAIKDGRLEWRIVNVEEPGNEHFVQDFQLVTRSVVLERLANGKRREWKNLQRVWELVRGDKAAFIKYIQDETGSFIEVVSK